MFTHVHVHYKNLHLLLFIIILLLLLLLLLFLPFVVAAVVVISVVNYQSCVWAEEGAGHDAGTDLPLAAASSEDELAGRDTRDPFRPSLPSPRTVTWTGEVTACVDYYIPSYEASQRDGTLPSASRTSSRA